MDKEQDGISLNHFLGSCSISDNKRWTDVDFEEISKTIMQSYYSDEHKYRDYKLTVINVSKL
jgi:hypothetical protein